MRGPRVPAGGHARCGLISPGVTVMVCTAALFATEYRDAALKAMDELLATIEAQLVLPKVSVSRVGSSSVRSVSSSAKVSSLRM